MSTYHLSTENEFIVRRILQSSAQPMAARDLVKRLHGCGIYPSYAYHVISAGFRLGFLVRHGVAGNYSYSLNPDYVRGAQTYVEPHAKVQRSKPVPAATWPAFTSGPLVPALGLPFTSQEEAEGELPPCVGARLVTDLRVQFDRVFGSAE
ncbi:hypothetical protein ACTJI2_13585 [Pseudoxanthomonas sp. 22568]|uniref:hypothetical protein n=1 Tax=Pseudoxanthomonas sp. 22568 TaxID=3453945 RepID=UPI003F85150B